MLISDELFGWCHLLAALQFLLIQLITVNWQHLCSLPTSPRWAKDTLWPNTLWGSSAGEYIHPNNVLDEKNLKYSNEMIMNGVVFTVFLLDLASSMWKLFWKMLWGRGSEGGWCFACVMTEWGLRLQVVTSNIYTTCDIVNICLYVCCVSVYAYDRMKYCSVFFS